MSRILNIELKEFQTNGLDGTYKVFGTALSNPAIKVNFFNTSAVDAYVSKDNATNWVRIPAGAALTLDESTLYFRGVDQEYYLPRGTQLRVKQQTAAGAAGTWLIAHVITRVLA